MDLEYADSTGKFYRVGDIVLNPFINDVWVVQKCSKEDKERYGLELDYCLALNNDKDDYVIDIDEPAGFKIICRIGEENYEEIIRQMSELAERRKDD